MTDTVEPEKPKIAWRALVGTAIGGGAIVIAALLGIGAIKSEGASNVRAGGPGGGQFPGQQFGPPGQMQGRMPPPVINRACGPRRCG